MHPNFHFCFKKALELKFAIQMSPLLVLYNYRFAKNVTIERKTIIQIKRKTQNARVFVSNGLKSMLKVIPT